MGQKKGIRHISQGEFVFDTKSGKEIFKIDGVLGCGGSCVVYKVRHGRIDPESGNAVFESRNAEVLKEYCPQFLVDKGGFTRTKPEIELPEKLSQRYRNSFESDKDGFRKTYDFINEYLAENEKESFFHSKQYGFYEGYGTVYINTEYESGKTLASSSELDLLTLLKIVRSTAIAVKHYHEKGYLHLDIKPQNFFLVGDLEGKTSGIRQFDYNSIVKISDIKDAIMNDTPDDVNITKPGDNVYSVPELDDGDLCFIGVKTDIFEIGAMLYSCLVDTKEIFHGFDRSDEIDLSGARLLDGTSDFVISELKEFFRKTTSTSPNLRYSHMSEVEKHLEQIIEAETEWQVGSGQKEILKDLTLVSDEGISEESFVSVTSASRSRLYCLIYDGEVILKNGILSLPAGYYDIIRNNKRITKKQSYYKLADSLEKECTPSEGIRKVRSDMNALRRALHLKELYNEESPERRIRIRLILARICIGMYNKRLAAEYLNEARELASADELWESPEIKALVPHIITVRGDYEYTFGSCTAALERYRKAEKYARDPEYGCEDAVITAILRAAECCIKNGDVAGAYEEYEKARYYSQLHDMTDHTVKIAAAAIEFCHVNGYSSEKETYENILRLANERIGESDAAPDIAGRAERVFTAGEYFPDTEEYRKYLDKERSEHGASSLRYKYDSRFEWVCSILEGDYSRGDNLCKDTLEFIIATHGKNSDEAVKQYIAMARLYPKRMMFSRAEKCANKAIDICKSNTNISPVLLYRARLELAGCLIRSGRLAEAESIISKIPYSKYSGATMLTERLFAIGEGLCELGYASDAEDLCTRISAIHGVDPYVKTYAELVRATARCCRGHYSEAKNICLNKVLSLVESMKDCPAKTEWKAKCHRIVAEAYFREKKYGCAETTISSAIDLCRGDESYLHHLYRDRGTYYAADGKAENAASDFKMCENILLKNNFGADSFVMLYNSMMKERIAAKDPCGAEAVLERLLKVKPSVTNGITFTDALVCFTLGALAAEKNDLRYSGKMFSSAYKNLERMGATLTEECISSLDGLIPAYERMGYTDTARRTRELASVLRQQKDIIQTDL